MRTAVAALAVSLVPLASACAMTANDTPIVETDAGAGDASVLSKAWNDGKKLEAKGIKLLAESEKRQLDGAKKMREGEQLTVNGASKVTAQKSAYVEAVKAFGLATTPKQVKAEIKTLRMIAENWDNGLDDIKRGEDMMKDGEKDVAVARSKKRKGEQMIADGREQMRVVETRNAAASAAKE